MNAGVLAAGQPYRVKKHTNPASPACQACMYEKLSIATRRPSASGLVAATRAKALTS